MIDLNNDIFKQWACEYKPICNKYYDKAPFDGTMFDLWLLPQISGFITEKAVWTLFYEDKKVLRENDDEAISVSEMINRKYYLQSGVNGVANLVGYFVTDCSYENPKKIFLDEEFLPLPI